MINWSNEEQIPDCIDPELLHVRFTHAILFGFTVENGWEPDLIGMPQFERDNIAVLVFAAFAITDGVA